jgi:RNA polymerase sigma factor (sigma-70 family)
LTEQELIERCLKGDGKAEKALFDRYAGKMMALCLRYAIDRSEAEDLLQEGFIRAFEYLRNFRSEGSLEGWLRRVMITTALKHVRKSKHFDELSIKEDFKESPELPEAISHLGEMEINKLINELPAGYKNVFNLYVVEGYKHQEIAELLGIEEGTSRSQLVKARKWLQDKILKSSRTILL